MNALKKATAARTAAEKHLADLHARAEATRTALDLAIAEKTAFAAQHHAFIIGRADALPPGALPGATAAVDQMTADLAALDSYIAAAEDALVIAEEGAEGELRAEWYAVRRATEAQLIDALASIGWKGWRAAQCSGEDNMDYRRFMLGMTERALERMYPVNPSMLDQPPECPDLPLPTRYRPSPLVSLDRRTALKRMHGF